MERRAIICPVTSQLETVNCERTSLGVIIEGCTRFPSGTIECPRECARRIDRHERADNDDPTERVLVVYAHERGPAEVVAHALHLDDLTVELADACIPGAPPPEDYDAVVLVVRNGWFHHARAIEAFVRDHEPESNARLIRTFVVPRRRALLESRAHAFVRLFVDEIPAAV